MDREQVLSSWLVSYIYIAASFGKEERAYEHQGYSGQYWDSGETRSTVQLYCNVREIGIGFRHERSFFSTNFFITESQRNICLFESLD